MREGARRHNGNCSCHYADMTHLKRLPTLLTLGFAASLFLADARGKPTLKWSQGDPAPEEQQAMEWLNAARNDPPGTLAGILSLSGSDPVISAFLLAGSPVTADQLGMEIRADWAQALADSASFPASEAVSRAPLAFYPLFQQQAGPLVKMREPLRTDAHPATVKPENFVGNIGEERFVVADAEHGAAVLP